MFADAVSFLWSAVDTKATPQPEPKRRPSPIFIGDAVQPWGRETFLLEMLRRDADDQSTE